MRDDQTLSRWCSAKWITVLLEKHAWLSAGLIWLPEEASETGRKAVFDEPKGKAERMPTVSLFEPWEEGAQVARALDARNYHLPSWFALMCPWHFSPKAVSLREAIGVANDSLIPGSHYPNQLVSSKGSTECS